MWNNFLHAPLLLQITTVLYILAAVAYLLSLFVRSKTVNWAALSLLGAGFLFNGAFEIARWIEAGRVPMKSRFEVMILLSFCIASMSLVAELVSKVRFVSILGSIAILIFMSLAFVWYDPYIENLPAALQSWWFFPHVIVYFFGYAAAAVSFFTALMSIFYNDPERLLKRNLVLKEDVDLEHYTYRVIIFAFTMLTLGMIMGALWAKDAWGTYWAWDPKENWALVSFMVYGLYLHFRKMPGWRGKKAAWFAVLGFAAVIITLLGVSYLPTAMQSEHVYLD
jgi:cytochrome c-type biogenesis protein CcsB